MNKIFSLLGEIGILALSTISFTFAYTQEQESAYNSSYRRGITTQPTIEDAKMNSPLTRQAFAKMIVNYLENAIGIKQLTSNSCNFPDEDRITDDLLPYAKKVCAYGIMGSDGKNFNPTEIVDRAQLGTVFSRILWGDRYNVDGKGYYIYHVNALKDVGIMNDINNVLGEPAMRGDVMIMFERMFHKFGYSNLTNDKDNIITFLRTKFVYLEGEPIIDNDSGIWESYYKNGQLEAKGVYKNGALDGEFFHYYNDGQLHLKYNFKNGSWDGEYVIYGTNGQISEKGNVKNGKTDGERITYDKDGRIVSICNCIYLTNTCECTDYTAPKWELSDSAEITVEKNMVVGEATNLKITMMKDGAVMKGYTGTIIMMVTNESGAILYSSEYELPNHGMYTFLPSDLGSKEFQKGLEIKKEGRFYIEIEDLNDETTLGKQLVTVRYSGDVNNDSLASYSPNISNIKTEIDADNNTVYLTRDVDDDSLISGYLINYWIDGFSGSSWAETKDFYFTDVPHNTKVNMNITPYRDNYTKYGKTSETIQFAINS